ncbi:MAG: nucleotidyl transferase AbiEii/AbiGii toxin family protein, partial [Lachnospiraceae bacterium]|nr:nucleotidyl transferase AbiEii/AbiGii toxin family protein [Lachnospiraceae bacterium]
RTTMDMDTTVKAIPLNLEDTKKIVEEICNIPVEDGVTFVITSVDTIMDDFDYPGVRIHIEARLERMRNTIKIDISTDDVITPDAVEYEYKLMFEDRSINIYTYNTETLLAEKIQTILKRGLANTRMRDFYDLSGVYDNREFDLNILKKAFDATCKKRETIFSDKKIVEEIAIISTDEEMRHRWNSYKVKNYYVGELDWDRVIKAIREIMEMITGD